MKKAKLPTDINKRAKSIVDIATGESEDKNREVDEVKLAAQALGRLGGLKGGKARANSMTINELEQLKKDLLDRVENIEKTIITLKSMSFSFSGNGNEPKKPQESSNKPTGKYSDYDKSATIRNKVAYVLKKENRFLRVREMAEILHSLEPEISVSEFIDSKLSAPITYLKGQKAIVKIMVGKSAINTFWGSAKWVDENGNPKPEHIYDEKQILNNTADEIEI